jgi:hypothetical protein
MASDETPAEVLTRVALALEEAAVPYMVTGSVASTLHGAPRATQDIDVVIAPTLGSLERLLKQFPDDHYYVSREAALQAYGNEGLFNLVDFETGWKVDFIIRKAREFSQVEFERRVETDALGRSFFVASAEDVLISKLEWSKLSDSERQLLDVAGIIKTQGRDLDRTYVELWVTRLDLETQWAKAQSLAAPGA